MQIGRFQVKACLAIVLAAFFTIGAVGNIFVSAEIAADYARWGYPDWFHYVTGVLEAITAILLARKSTRGRAGLLGAVIMASAAFTLFMHGEFLHAIAPLVVFAMCCLVVRLYRPGGGAGRRSTAELT